MKTKYFWISVTLSLLLYPALSVRAQEGHPSGWWEAKTSDMIVEGVITYDPASYYELSPVNIAEPRNIIKSGTTYYWIVGKLKIKKVLFVNKDSQHLESYQQYVKEIDKDLPVLIPAENTILFMSHSASPPKSLRLRPILGLDITNEPTIFNLSQIWIYPILNLKLESVVPRENMSDAIKLIKKRANNLLTKQ